MAFISEFTTDINHLAGKNNVVADCRSRPVIDNVSIGNDYIAMAKPQVACEEIQVYRTAITKLKLADMPVSQTGPVFLCDVSTGTPRPIVSIQYRRKVFDVIHSLVHPGRKATQKLVSQKFVWH